MATIAERLKKWFSEPQDIVGLATWAGTTGIAVSQYLSAHTVSLPVLIGGAVAGLVALVVPTGGTVSADAGKLASDVAQAVVTKDAALAPEVISDAAKIVTDVEKTAVPAPVATK